MARQIIPSEVTSSKPTVFFIALMAMISSFAALSIDIMLPALPDIGRTYAVDNIDLQQVITIFTLGMVFGELVFGPASDRFGRRPFIILSSGFFLIGACMCLFAPSYEWLLVGRALQGVGAAGPKIIVRAMLRDLYTGDHLARVFSLIYTLFIFIPMMAPLLGQGISAVVSWQGIFVFLFLFALVSIVLFALTQKETLPFDKRQSLHILSLAKTSRRIMSHARVVLYTIFSGCIFGIKLTYLSNAQQMFAEYYNVTDAFPLYFALLASAIGLAFFLNARLVLTFGGYTLSNMATNMLLSMTLLLVVATWLGEGIPHFVFFIVSFYGIFFTFGILWGNIGALAMEYLGEVAGIGATLFSSLSSLVAFIIALWIGQFFGPRFLMIAVNFCGVAVVSRVIFTLAARSAHTHKINMA